MRPSPATVIERSAPVGIAVYRRGRRCIYGCYFHVSEEHLHRYLAEFDFRYSNRSALGIEDGERTDRAIKGAKGKRLTYETTRSGRSSEEEIPF